MGDRLIRITTALAVAAVAAVAAVISYRHAYELVSSHGESGLAARLVPFTWTASSWRRACSCSTPVDGTSPDHHWRGGASVLASSPPSVPPWRTASVTGLSVP